jgi:hypothetical protein
MIPLPPCLASHPPTTALDPMAARGKKLINGPDGTMLKLLLVRVEFSCCSDCLRKVTILMEGIQRAVDVGVVMEFIEGLVETYSGLQHLDGFPQVSLRDRILNDRLHPQVCR